MYIVYYTYICIVTLNSFCEDVVLDSFNRVCSDEGVFIIKYMEIEDLK